MSEVVAATTLDQDKGNVIGKHIKPAEFKQKLEQKLQQQSSSSAANAAGGIKKFMDNVTYDQEGYVKVNTVSRWR